MYVEANVMAQMMREENLKSLYSIVLSPCLDHQESFINTVPDMSKPNCMRWSFN